MNSKKAKYLFFILGISLSFFLMVLYYHEEFGYLWSNPSYFWSKLKIAANLESFSLQAFAISMSFAGLALFLDLLIKGWKYSALNRLVFKLKGNNAIDAWSFFLTVTKIYDVLFIVLTGGLFYFIASLVKNLVDFNLTIGIENPWIVFALLFVITDFKSYLSHRIMHLSAFWPAHELHHSATEFNLITATRGHFLETGFRYVLTAFFWGMFGSNQEEAFTLMLWTFALHEFYEYLLHADLDWNLGWMGRWILISPKAHRIHHSIEERHYNGNYGTFFIWWDKLFGTYKGNREMPEAIGIRNNEYVKTNYWNAQWIGFKRFLRIGS